MLEEEVQDLSLRLDEVDKDYEGLEKKLSGMQKRIDFIMQTIKVPVMAKEVSSGRTQQVALTLAQLYKEATYHAEGVVGSPPPGGGDPQPSEDAEPAIPEPAEGVDPAEESAARERLQAIRKEFLRGRLGS